MKTFLVVFSVILLAFGGSILYYRGDFAGSKTQVKSVNQVADNGNVAPAKETKVLAETTTTVQYSSLEIKQAIAGNIKVGQSLTFTAIGKDKNGKKSAVPGAWLLSDPNVASLDKNGGQEVVLKGLKIGKTKLTVVYANLNTSLNLTVIASLAVDESRRAAPVLGSSTTTTGATIYGLGSSVQSTEIKPYVIYLYDYSGSRFSIGETRTFTSQVQYNDNSLKTPDLNWSLDPPDLGSLDRTSGSSLTFKASRSGNGNLKATFENLSASLYIQVN